MKNAAAWMAAFDAAPDRESAELVVRAIQRDARDGAYAEGYRDGHGMGFDEAIELATKAIHTLRPEGQ